MYIWSLAVLVMTTRQGWAIATETVWLEKPKIFIWPLSRKRGCAGKKEVKLEAASLKSLLFCFIGMRPAGCLLCDGGRRLYKLLLLCYIPHPHPQVAACFLLMKFSDEQWVSVPKFSEVKAFKIAPSSRTVMQATSVS